MLGDPQRRRQPVTNVALELKGVAGARDGQVLEVDASLGRGDALAANLAHDVLEVGPEVKRPAGGIHDGVRVCHVRDWSRLPLLLLLSFDLLFGDGSHEGGALGRQAVQLPVVLLL